MEVLYKFETKETKINYISRVPGTQDSELSITSKCGRSWFHFAKIEDSNEVDTIDMGT